LPAAAGEQVRGGFHLVCPFAVVPIPPVGVARFRVSEPVAEKGLRTARDLGVRFADGQVHKAALDPAPNPELRKQGLEERGTRVGVLLLKEDGVGEGEVQVERAVRVEDRVEARAADLRHDRPEKRRCAGRGSPLSVRQVAHAPQPQRTVEPGLLGDPLDRRPAVGVLAGEDVEFPLGIEAPTDVLDEHVVAPLRHLLGDEEAGSLPTVGRTDEDGREAARLARAVAVRDKLDAVRHGGAQTTLDGDVMKRGRQPEQARGEAPPVAVDTERG
jgi:hypothetical protein